MLLKFRLVNSWSYNFEVKTYTSPLTMLMMLPYCVVILNVLLMLRRLHSVEEHYTFVLIILIITWHDRVIEYSRISSNRKSDKLSVKVRIFLFWSGKSENKSV